MDILNVVFPHNGILYDNKKEWSTDAYYNIMNLLNIMLSASS